MYHILYFASKITVEFLHNVIWAKLANEVLTNSWKLSFSDHLNISSAETSS